jgi:polyhydroxyalkanoate synthesis repressor PhaR
MSELRTIKKYPNRRLYDTVESRYITLSDIRKLVIERIDFVVIDKKSQEDITRSILLQVIAEQEHGVEPLMSRDFLSQVIRSYGGATQGMIGSYLEQSLKLFATQQREARDRGKSMGETETATANNQAVSNLAQKNYQRWRQVQDEIYRTLMNAGRSGREHIEEEPASGSPSYSHAAHD